MSASEAMPRSPSEASMRGPTPGSSVTGRERRSVRVVRAGRGAPCAPPALEVGNAIGSKAHVGPDDPPDLSDELLLDPELFSQLGEELGGGDVPEVELMSGLRGRPDLLDDGRHLALATTGAFERHDLPARYLEHRPDIEGCAEETLRPSYAPALGQVLQRAHGKEHPRRSDSPLSGAPDLVEVPTLVDTAQGLEQDQTRPHLGALGVEYVHRTVYHPSRLQGRVVGTAKLARERENQDVVVVGERLVGFDEGAGGGLSRSREHVRIAQALVELLVGHVYLVRIRLIFAEVERERDHPDVGTLQHAWGEARGRVGYYRRGHSAAICRGYNGCPPSLASTSRPSSRSLIPSIISSRSASVSSSPLSRVKTSAPPSTIFLAITSAAWLAPSSTAMRSPSRNPM